MAIDLVQLRKIARGNTTAEPMLDVGCSACISLLDYVRYARGTGWAQADSIAYIQRRKIALLAFGLMYGVLGVLALGGAAVAVLLAFLFSSDLVAWPFWLKLPLAILGAMAGFYVVLAGAAALGVLLLLAWTYLAWGRPGILYRGAAASWILVPDMLVRVKKVFT